MNAEKKPSRKRIRARSQELRRLIGRMDFVASGTIHVRTKVCGRKNCKCATDPEQRRVAHQRLQELRVANPHGRVYQDRWEALLGGPLPSLLRMMTETSEQADALRKESPFTILVTPDERRRVFTDVRAV